MTTRFGFLTLRPAQELDYATELAKRAAAHHIEVVRFVPVHIQPLTEHVHGHIFQADTGEWTKKTFPIPSVIYDRCFYSSSDAAKKGRPIVEWLKKRHDVTFLGHGLPDKLETHRILSAARAVSPYLPQTVPADAESVWELLQKRGEAALKPVNGSGGNGFCRLALRRDGISASLQQGRQANLYTFRTKEELTQWLTALFTRRPFLLQPHLSVQDRYGRPFDIRILLQKDANGEWQETGRGVRLGAPKTLVSNLHAGSSCIPYSDWKAAYSRRDLALLEDNLATLAAAVPRALESELPPLFEIGLDISVDRSRAVWLLDVNSKPGRKVIASCMPDRLEQLYQAPLAYCRYLQREGADIS